ncbi:glucosamine-6-phosphate deaminase [Aciduricibacillus chroicocephali]|uniref:Glucosamine-6-phosphate deaminase n=1 Tax=Aciduricibacillus chroicocephali TaxID=3054939 RepID=A0ABY9KW90_9BACI|nr:glucosamine-6-phosphate deaminase [Bacillaceae bacterium 44XB]
MKILKVKNYEQLSKAACDIVTKKIKNIEHPVLGLATGSTPEGLYKCLIERYEAGEITFANATSFNLDEYVGLDETHPGSYQYYMKDKLFNHINLPAERAFVPSGTDEDLQAHCEAYEDKIKKAGKIDIQILGIGINGHIGFNEPGTSFDSRTHVVELDESTREVNSRFFNSLDEVPTKAVTMGIQTIMDADEVVLIISGENKADTVLAFMESEISEEFPASILKKHPNFTLIVDEPAYSKVPDNIAAE